MLIDFDPVIVSVGPLAVRWYGVMYVIGFIVGSKLLTNMAKDNFLKTDVKNVDSLVTYLIIGMFLCARIFYVFVYNFEDTHNFIDVIAVWRGGLSFHGAIIGFAIAMAVFAKRKKVPFWSLADSVCLAATPGVFFGRMGNFINGELYGRATDSAIGMVFASDPEKLTRHPSQLYEAFGEGILLFLVLSFVRKKIKVHGGVAAGLLIGYGIVRFIIEFFREADAQMGYYFGNTFTMGQILCFLMIFWGIAVYIISRKRNIPV